MLMLPYCQHACKRFITDKLQGIHEPCVASCNEETAFHLLNVLKTAEFQSVDDTLGCLKNQSGYANQIVTNTAILCKDGKFVIPMDSQDRSVA